MSTPKEEVRYFYEDEVRIFFSILIKISQSKIHSGELIDSFLQSYDKFCQISGVPDQTQWRGAVRHGD